MPRDRLRLWTAETDLATHSFHKHAIAHRFFPACGIHAFGKGVDRKGSRMAAVNLRCLEDFDLAYVTVTEFDGRAL